jgi:hypothetical protein
VLERRLPATNYALGTYADILSDLAFRVYTWQCGWATEGTTATSRTNREVLPLKLWLRKREAFTIVCLNHLFIDYLRKRFRASSLESTLDFSASDAKGQLSAYVGEVVPGVLLDIQTLAKMLPSDEQEVFLLEAQGYTHKQTAERLKKAEANIRRLYMKAKARIALKLGEEPYRLK